MFRNINAKAEVVLKFQISMVHPQSYSKEKLDHRTINSVQVSIHDFTWGSTYWKHQSEKNKEKQIKWLLTCTTLPRYPRSAFGLLIPSQTASSTRYAASSDIISRQSQVAVSLQTSGTSVRRRAYSLSRRRRPDKLFTRDLSTSSNHHDPVFLE